MSILSVRWKHNTGLRRDSQSCSDRNIFLMNYPDVEITSSRVSKGACPLFVPKITSRNRNQKQKEKEPEPQRETLHNEPNSPAQEQLTPLPAKINLPSHPAKGNKIAVPSALRESDALPTPEPDPNNEENEFDEKVTDISQFTIKALIKSKFERGELSSFTKVDLEEKQMKRKGKKGLVESSFNEDKSISVKGSPGSSTPEATQQTQQIVNHYPIAVPQFKMVNGAIQIDTSTLQVYEEQNEDYSKMQRIDEDINRRVTSSSFRNKKRAQHVKWTTEMTRRFYEGLQMFGTNFELISLMFPELTRRHLKLKFQAEETRNSSKITEALRKPIEPSDELKDRMFNCIPDKEVLFLQQYHNPPTSLLIDPPNSRMETIGDLKTEVETQSLEDKNLAESKPSIEDVQIYNPAVIQNESTLVEDIAEIDKQVQIQIQLSQSSRSAPSRKNAVEGGISNNSFVPNIGARRKRKKPADAELNEPEILS